MKIGWKLWADEVVSAWTVWGEPGTVYVEYAPPVGCPMSSWPSPLRTTSRSSPKGCRRDHTAGWDGR